MAGAVPRAGWGYEGGGGEECAVGAERLVRRFLCFFGLVCVCV